MQVTNDHHRYVTDLVAPSLRGPETRRVDAAARLRADGPRRVAQRKARTAACVPCFAPDVRLPVPGSQLAAATPMWSPAAPRDRCSRLALRSRGRSPGLLYYGAARSATSSSSPARSRRSSGCRSASASPSSTSAASALAGRPDRRPAREQLPRRFRSARPRADVRERSRGAPGGVAAPPSRPAEARRSTASAASSRMLGSIAAAPRSAPRSARSPWCSEV